MEGSSYKNTEGYPDPTAHQAISKADYAMRGKKSREDGQRFENMIAASLEWHRIMNLANIEKTPEPMKPLGKPDRHGRFIACYTAAAQPDFKGTLMGGWSVVFEAKYTGTDRMNQNRVTEEQSKAMNSHNSLGALAFVIIGFGNGKCYRIPWDVWKNMKEKFGRKYISIEDDLEEYEISCISGVLKMFANLLAYLPDDIGG